MLSYLLIIEPQRGMLRIALHICASISDVVLDAHGLQIELHEARVI